MDIIAGTKKLLIPLAVASFCGQVMAAGRPDSEVKRSAQMQGMQGMPMRTDPGSSEPLTPTLQPLPAASAPSAPAHDLSSAPGAVPSAGVMGLSEFERLALQLNPTLRQGAAQFEATLSRSFQAGLYPNPVVGYIQDQIGSFSESRPTANGFSVRGKPSPGDNVGAFVQQEIVTAGKLRLSRAKFAEEAQAARWQAVAQEMRVINGVRIAYFEAVAAQRLVAIHGELVRLNDDAVKTTEELSNVGQANEPDLLQARVEGRRARVALRNAQNHLRGDWEELVAIVGMPALRPVPLDAVLLEAKAEPLDFDRVLAHLIDHSPEIQAARSEIRRDQIMVRRERVEPIPNIFVQAVTGYNYEFGVQTAGVQIGIPIPIFNRNQGTVREAMSDLARDHAEYDRIALSLRERLAGVYTRYEDALQSAEDYREGTLPLARRAYEVQMTNFRQRRAAWPQVLVARRTYLDLTKDYVESLRELRQAEVEINGMLLTGGLESPATPTSQGHIESVPTPR